MQHLFDAYTVANCDLNNGIHHRCRGKVQCNHIRELRMAPGNQAVQQEEPSKKLQQTVFVYKYANVVYFSFLIRLCHPGWISECRPLCKNSKFIIATMLFMPKVAVKLGNFSYN